jgi:hypothetical protein
LAGDIAMALSVFAVLVVTVAVGIAWGGAAIALRQSEEITIEQADDTGDWTIAETGPAPVWPIAPDHMRMW